MCSYEEVSVLTVPVRGSLPSFDPASDPRTPTLAPSAVECLARTGSEPRVGHDLLDAELMPDPFLIELVPDRVDLLLGVPDLLLVRVLAVHQEPHLGPLHAHLVAQG